MRPEPADHPCGVDLLATLFPDGMTCATCLAPAVYEVTMRRLDGGRMARNPTHSGSRHEARAIDYCPACWALLKDGDWPPSEKLPTEDVPEIAEDKGAYTIKADGTIRLKERTRIGKG